MLNVPPPSFFFLMKTKLLNSFPIRCSSLLAATSIEPEKELHLVIAYHEMNCKTKRSFFLLSGPEHSSEQSNLSLPQKPPGANKIILFVYLSSATFGYLHSTRQAQQSLSLRTLVHLYHLLPCVCGISISTMVLLYYIVYLVGQRQAANKPAASPSPAL